MATLVLGTVGQVVGTALGGPVGAAIGGAIGTYVGGLIDQSLFGPKGVDVPRPGIPQVQSSAYGKEIPIIFGSARVAGNVIWMGNHRITDIEEEVSKKESQVVGHSVLIDLAIGLSAVGSLIDQTLVATATVEDEVLEVTVREALCGFRRVWCDGTLAYDARTINSKIMGTGDISIDDTVLFDGSESQEPSEHIEQFEGVGNVPAYRGLGYLLIRDVAASNYGNRIPNIEVEVVASMPKLYAQEGLSGLVEGADGSIYIASHVRRTVTRIDPYTYKQFAIIGETDDYLGSLKAHPMRMTVDDDGNIIVTCFGDRAVQKIDPATNEVVATATVDYYPWGIATDLDGYIWVTHPTLDLLTKIDPSDMSVVDTFAMPGSPREVEVASGGALWITCDDSVVRFNPTLETIVATIPVGIFPWGVTQNRARDNEIWVAVSGENALAVISKADNEVMDYVNAGTYPTCVNCHKQDTVYGGVAVTTFYGNRIAVYNSSQDVNNQGEEVIAYNRLINDGTVSFPSECLFLLNGVIIVTQTKYDFCLANHTR